jgi:hypothetical protein
MTLDGVPDRSNQRPAVGVVLDQIILGALLHRAHAELLVVDASEHDDRDPREPGDIEQRQPDPIGQMIVDQRAIELLGAQHGGSRGQIDGLGEVEEQIGTLEGTADREPVDLIVLDEQDPQWDRVPAHRAPHCIGQVNRSSVPRLPSECSETSPPCAVTIFLTKARPIPVLST